MAISLAEIDNKMRPFALAGLAASCILAGGFVGGSINAANGWISPYYFESTLGWYGIEDVWRASIAQGILEGLIFGVFCCLAFAPAAAVITGVTCRYWFGCRAILVIVGSAYVCWAAGGFVAVGLAALSPEYFVRTFDRAPKDFGPMLGYAWVGGSIVAVEMLSWLGLCLGVLVLLANWRRRLRPRLPPLSSH
jgi:hypothetical protein